jgi:hypothetical protein
MYFLASSYVSCTENSCCVTGKKYREINYLNGRTKKENNEDDTDQIAENQTNNHPKRTEKRDMRMNRGNTFITWEI